MAESISICRHNKNGTGYCERLGEYCVEGPCKTEELIEYAPVRHGRWELGNVEPGYFTPGGNRPWVCSECGRIVSWCLEKPTEEYCHCGCKMDKEG